MINDNNKFVYELLLKKWELLWNHYKFQDEMMEKRRNFLWIIQSFIFIAWYYSFLKSIEYFYCAPAHLFKYLSIGIPIFGIIINIILLILLKRHRLSVIIDEEALRDIEYQCNSLCYLIKLDRFSVDKKLLYYGSAHKWDFTGEFIDKNKYIRWSSQRRLLNIIIPNLFILIWFLILIFITQEAIIYIINNYVPDLFFFKL